MHVELKESGLATGRHRVARLMRENDLIARQKTRFKRSPIYQGNTIGAISAADHVRYQGNRVDLRPPGSDVEIHLYLERHPELGSTVGDRRAFTVATLIRLEACS